MTEHRPPLGRSEVHTTRDLARYAQRLDRDRIDERFEALGTHIAAAMSDFRATIERELRLQTTTFIVGYVSVVMIMSALTFALVRFS